MCFKDGALSTERLNVLTTALRKILAEIVAELAPILKLARTRRKLSIKSSAVAEPDRIVKLAKAALSVLALVLVLSVLLAFTRVSIIASRVSLISSATTLCSVIIVDLT